MESKDNVRYKLAHRTPFFYGWIIVAAGMGIDLWYSIVWFYGMQVFFTPLSAHFAWSRTAMSGAFETESIH